jgi:hypothetical protein
MNHNHHTPQPTPGALCLAYASLLPLLSLGKLDQDERAAVALHVATCAHCRREVGDFDRLRDALRREDMRAIGAETGALAISLADVQHAADHEGADALVFDGSAPWQERPGVPIPWRERIGIPHRRRRMAVVGAIEALAALLVIALLGGLLASRHPAGPGPSGSPRLDVASQAYLTMLHTYYDPLVPANHTAQDCVHTSATWDPSQTAERFQLMLTCRPPLVTELTAAQIFTAKLATAVPPARWRAEHAMLGTAMADLFTVLNSQIAAIDARSLAQFVGTLDQAASLRHMFETPIAQINLQIHAGPPPLPPPLTALWFDYG